ncbi:endonuclease domain-containing protein [Pseudonocardia sp. GCM10023141]|uniref:endonuclease domain-containing protein n=1 Tax=Pseudonocardia sp. GCM10023141 TaxID=3252653 RepID=UPI00360CD5D1
MGIRVVGKLGACRRSELVAELGRKRVRSAVTSGALVELWSGVVIDADRAATIAGRAGAALVAGGPASAITGPTAAHLHGCQAMPALPVHLMVPYEHSLRTQPGLVVHKSRHFQDVVQELDGLRVLALHRVVVDLLATAEPGGALAVVDQALALIPEAQRGALRQRLHAGLVDRDDPRGTVRGARILDLATGRVDSPMESIMLWTVAEAGLPLPEMNWPVLDIDGREIYRLDLAWPDLRIAIEYHGYAAHIGRKPADEARVRDLERRGWTVISVWAEDLQDKAAVIATIRAALARRGCAS